MTAQLLVSVRTPQEAMAARLGGADIIDVKEPSKGSLGAASPDVISQIIQSVRRSSPTATISAAMGEVHDFDVHKTGPNNISPEINGQLSFLKCGLSGLRTANPPTSWKHAWTRVREQSSQSGINTPWVAVSYADWERSESPTPFEVLTEGQAFGSPILLIDTFTKDDTNLLDWLGHAQLKELREATREAGMKLALAGRIMTELLPKICEHSPDIVAVRGAACEQGTRTKAVTAERVRTLRARLTSLLHHSRDHC